MNVAELKPNMRSVDLTVKVVRIEGEREVTSRRDGKTHRLVEVLVGDETGTVVLSLWDGRADGVREGDVLRIKNGYTTVVRGHLRLSVGRYGSVEVVPPGEAGDMEVNEEVNVSEISCPQPRRFSFPGRARRFGGRGPR